MPKNLIIDAHLDLGWNALQWNRDITQSVYTIRTQEASQPGRGQNTVALPEMREGKVLLCIGTLMGRNTGRPVPHVDFVSPAQTKAVARSHLMYYHALEQLGHVKIIEDRNNLEEFLTGLEDDQTQAIGLVISMESADGILSPDELGEWYSAGVRVIGPAHYGMGRYVGGTGVEDGFTDIGFELLKEMQNHEILLDVTHLSDRAFWQALENYDGLVIASHNNCRALVPHQRQLNDDQIKAIVERDGVIGSAFDVWMLRAGWAKGYDSNQGITLSDIVDHIDYICQLTGNTNHVGIGSDLDGGFGREQSPADLDTIADLQKFVPLLQERGYTESDIVNILHENWLRVFRTALP